MARKSLWSLGTGRSRRTFGPWGACRSWLSFRSGGCLRIPGRSRRPGGPLRPSRTRRALLSARAGRPFRPRIALRSGCAVLAGFALRPGRAGRSGLDGCDGRGLFRRGRSFRTALAAEADNRLPLLVLRLKVHDAGRRMIGDPEGEPAVGIGLRLEPFIEEDRRLPRLAQAADDTQLAGGDHGLIDEDIGHGRCAACNQEGSG